MPHPVTAFPAFSAHLRYPSFPTGSSQIFLKIISQIKAVQTDGLTCKSLVDPFCRESKDSENLDRYLYDQFRHPIGQSHFSICLKAFEKVFDPRKQINEHFLGRINILSCLTDLRVGIVCAHQENCVP